MTVANPATGPAAAGGTSPPPAARPPGPARTLITAFRDHVAADPSALTVVVHGRSHRDELTRGRLGRLAAGQALALRDRGVGVGDRVVIAWPTSAMALAAFWGCQMLGAVAVPAPAPRRGNRDAERVRCEAIIRRAHPMAVSMPDDRVGLLAPDARTGQRFVGATAEADPAAVVDATAGGPVAVGGDAPAIVQFTSGSTSEPRGCVLTHAALAANLTQMAVRMGIDHPQRGVLWCPLFHDMGLLSGVVLPVWAPQLVGVLMPPEDFVTSPLRWLQLMAEHRAEISAAPNTAFSLVERRLRRGLPDVDLSCVRSVICGGEPVSAATLRAFLARAAPLGFRPDAIQPAYGLAEHVLMVASRPAGIAVDRVHRAALAAGRADPAPTDRTVTAAGGSPAGDDASAPAPAGVGEVVSLGAPVDGCRVRIVDDAGRPLPERGVGEVEVRSPSVTSGYLDDPGATAALFRDGWLRTGDLGYLAGGELHLTGRGKDVVIVGGRNIPAFDVEDVAGSVDGVRAGAVVALALPGDDGEQLVVVVEARAAHAADVVARVKAACGRRIGVVPRTVLVVGPGRLPRTSSGKVRRARTRELIAEGGFAGPARGGASG